jgi:plastocyanin
MQAKRAMKRLLFAPAALVAAMMLAAPASAAPQQLTYRYGPIALDRFEVDQGTAFGAVPKPEVDGYVTHMEVDVVDANGQPISPKRLMLHHVVFLNLGAPGRFDHRDWTCSTFTGLDYRSKLPALADRFYAAGEERNKLDLPGGYGYPVKGDDSWIVTWMLMNHHGHSDTAYIQYKLTYETERALAPAYMVWLDVRNCLADPVFDVPGGGAPGSVFSRATTWTAREPGRIVAGGGHLHGGGRSITLSEPDCAGRELFSSRPLYGLASHPFYNVFPAMHEPGPIDMTGFTTADGIPVAAGQRLQISASYDNSRPHTRVMGIMGVYFSPTPGIADGCGPLPALQTHAAAGPGRAEPPAFTVPLARKPAGRWRRLGKRRTIRVGDFRYGRQRLRVPRGTRLRWKFDGGFLHNVTVASGPRGFSSPNLDRGRVFRQRLDVPGTYRLFCTLHPTRMTGEVKVERRRRR